MDTIWIVDDDEIFQFITRKSIEKIDTSKHIISYSNGEQAFKSINNAIHQENGLPDIILLDINMPVMDGWEFLQQYSGVSDNSNKKPTIYMVSSSIDQKDLIKAHNSVFITDYITKPIDEDKMIEILNNR